MVTFSQGLETLFFCSVNRVLVGGNWLKYANEVGSKIVIVGVVIVIVGIQCLSPLFVLYS